LEIREFKRVLQQVMILPVAALLLLAIILILQLRAASRIVDSMEQSERRIALAHLVERYLVDEETGLRGYQITSDSRFLDPYYTSQAPLQQAIQDLQATYVAGPSDNVNAQCLQSP
jgi:CHASE3 domain sensor protein